MSERKGIYDWSQMWPDRPADLPESDWWDYEISDADLAERMAIQREIAERKEGGDGRDS
jgi:hypothetical protein